MTWFARLYLWATYRLYREFAWAYDMVSWLVSLGRWSDWRRAALGHLVGERVLEVGFGTGELLLEMGAGDLCVVGLEPSLAMHRVAARKLARRGMAVPCVRGVAQAVPFPDGWFDSIVCTFPAKYILDPATLDEIARLLRPPDPVRGIGAGRLVVVGMVIWIDSSLWQRTMQFLFGVQEEGILDRFERLARAAGLKVRVVERERKGVRVPIVLAESQFASARRSAVLRSNAIDEE